MFENDGSQMLTTLTVGTHFRHCLVRFTISSECIDFGTNSCQMIVF